MCSTGKFTRCLFVILYNVCLAYLSTSFVVFVNKNYFLLFIYVEKTCRGE